MSDVNPYQPPEEENPLSRGHSEHPVRDAILSVVLGVIFAIAMGIYLLLAFYPSRW